MLALRPVSYQEFRVRPVAYRSIEMLEAELDKVKHHFCPVFDDNDDDSDFDTINADCFVDQDDETLGLITGVPQPRRYPYHDAGIITDDPCGGENRVDHGLRELEYDNAARDSVRSLIGPGYTQTLSCQAPARIQAALAQMRLSMDSDRSSLSYTGLYITNSRGSVFEAPVHSRWSVDARPSNLTESNNHMITSKRVIEDAENGVLNHYDHRQSAPSIMSPHFTVGTTGTLTPFTQGYATYKAEEEDFQIFLANALREEAEADMLALLQRRSMRRREQGREQKKSQKVGKIIKKSLKFIRQGFSNRRA